MYDNIGSKIKNSAKAVFLFESFIAVVGGLLIISYDDNLFLAGLLIIFIVPLVAWVSSWLLYGFGQLIENSDIIAEEYKRKNTKHHKKIAENKEQKEKEDLVAIEAFINTTSTKDEEFIDISCPDCNATLSYTKMQLQNNDKTSCPMCDATIKLKQNQ